MPRTSEVPRPPPRPADPILNLLDQCSAGAGKKMKRRGYRWLQPLDFVCAVTAAVVGIALGRFAELRGQIFHGAYREFRGLARQPASRQGDLGVSGHVLTEDHI